MNIYNNYIFIYIQSLYFSNYLHILNNNNIKISKKKDVKKTSPKRNNKKNPTSSYNINLIIYRNM